MKEAGDMIEFGTEIAKAGGGIIGAVALLIVGWFFAARYIWKAYQAQLNDAKKEDQAEKQALRDEIKALRDEGRQREEKLLLLVSSQQEVQRDTNQILTEIRGELAYLRGMAEAKKT
jgi:hypothetical protein